MKKAVIFGMGTLAEMLFFFLNQENMEIGGFTVDSKYRDTDVYMGLPIVDFETVDKIFPPDEYGMYICVGYTGMNRVREAKFHEAEEKGYEILSYRHPSAIINVTSIGKGNFFFENVTVGPFSEIGDGNILYQYVHFSHNTKMGNFNCYAGSTAVAGSVRVGSNCFFGINCAIRDDICIADGTLVGAGCYVDRSTEPYGVYVSPRSVKLPDKKSTDFL